MKAIIVAGGTPPSLKLLQMELTAGSSLIICADSGANCLYDYKIVPNYIIGDLDSISQTTLSFFQQQNVTFEQVPRNKDATDAFLALHKAIAYKATEIIFLGCTGGQRLDHFIGSLGLLNHCLSLNLKALIKDDNCTITLHDKPFTISGISGNIFSVFAYGDRITQLSISGAKYELNSYELKLGDPLTLSNEFLDTPVKINFTSGKLMLITTNTLCMTK